MITVTLGWSELYDAALAGVRRHVWSMQEKRVKVYGAPPDPWTADVEGCIGEVAVANFANLYWHSNPRCPARFDVGSLQVRSTTRKNGGLILHDRDADGDVFILVTLEDLPTAYLRGWCYGHEGKRDEYWRDKSTKPKFTRPAYCVPQSALRDMDTLTFTKHAEAS